nr:hypothetical protein [Bacilli bacterium]
MNDYFVYDERLGMHTPQLLREWHEYSLTERDQILSQWETLRGGIPAIISRFEDEIRDRQEKLHQVEEWDDSVRLLEEVNDYASRINDLNILFRTQPDLHD